jgi:cell shape-determining protein MreC
MRKHLNIIVPLAVSLALIILPPALTGRLRMFAAAPLRPIGEAERLCIQREAARSALASRQAYAANRAENALPEGRTVPAAVIFKGGTGTLHRSLYIDRGTLDGVREGMPVVCGGALVGVVNAAGPAMSEVTALGDPRLKVSVLLVPRNPDEATPPSGERVEGVLAGTAKEDSPLRLHYIWRKVDVARDDLVVTSGYSGRFPRGLVAGYVRGVTDKRDDLHHEIEVEPAAPFDGVDQVLVLIDWPVEVPPRDAGLP